MTETAWAGPGAAPVTTTGLVAERAMMGSLMQEVIRPPSDPARRAVARTDLLIFDRVEGIWRYVSFDMCFPVGLMTATGFATREDGAIHLDFHPFAALLPGSTAIGELRRMRQTIRVEGPDGDVKEQYLIAADGTARSYPAHRYACKRRA